MPADAIVDRLDYELSKKFFLGDAFPYINLDCFAPDIMSAFIGANLDNSSSHVWFKPSEGITILHLDKDNKTTFEGIHFLPTDEITTQQGDLNRIIHIKVICIIYNLYIFPRVKDFRIYLRPLC